MRKSVLVVYGGLLNFKCRARHFRGKVLKAIIFSKVTLQFVWRKKGNNRKEIYTSSRWKCVNQKGCKKQDRKKAFKLGVEEYIIILFWVCSKSSADWLTCTD